MTKRKFGDRIELRWDDSYSESRNAAYWTAPGDLDRKDPSRMTTVGYYVRETRRFLTVAQTIQADGDLGGTFSIPLAAIVKITKL